MGLDITTVLAKVIGFYISGCFCKLAGKVHKKNPTVLLGFL
jgi:hypothetical protein